MLKIFCCLILFTACNTFAQVRPIIGKTTYPFLLYLPADSILKNNPPVLVFLHGRSLSGSDLNRVKRYGIINEIERGRKIPAIVVAPQVRPSESWNPDKVLELVNYIQKAYATDTNRLYVAGMSLGGYGTFHFAGKYPEKVAAAGAFCGGGNLKDACRLSTVPLWVIHGKLDKAVAFNESDKMVKAIQGCPTKSTLLFTVLPNSGHGEPERYFHKDEFYQWLFSHQKNSPKK
ncbi:MAG: prolyl oligopeptidase family serine peptidase [Bacteroidetes bacterium]|nr:prolyl oligopeptidase family serine peptidase [Bacteroidota bacterium]